MSRVPIRLTDEKIRGQVVGLIQSLDISNPWQVLIEPVKKRRSLSQNNLYWKWVGIIAVSTGNDNDDIHDVLKAKFLTPREVEIFGEKRTVLTTAKLTTQEFKEYMDRVYAFATSQLGILLPLPEELGRDAA